jgi:hypothetical protein
MKRPIFFVTAIALWLCMISSVYALYRVSPTGTWPKTWPKELEPLRKQATTLVGPMRESSHYEIPFTKREEFEAAWPFILKVKTPGAPIILKKGPKTDFFAVNPAGVLIHSPARGDEEPGDAKSPLNQEGLNQHSTRVTYIELVVDRNIVDLNRIAMPADTLIFDERFKDEQKK